METVAEFIEIIPNIKLSFFTVAKMRGSPLFENQKWCDQLRYFIEKGNVKLGIHGLLHTQEEFKHLTYRVAFNKLEEAQEIFQKANLPYSKVFRGPHWGLNIPSISALGDMHFKYIYNHEDYKNLPSEIPMVYYNWNLKDPPPPKNNGLLIGHGHTHDVCQNGIKETKQRIIDFVRNNNVEFKFFDEIG
jgi:predicted deacetylase